MDAVEDSPNSETGGAVYCSLVSVIDADFHVRKKPKKPQTKEISAFPSFVVMWVYFGTDCFDDR